MASAFLSSGVHSATTPKLQGSRRHPALISALLSPQSCQCLCRVDIWNRKNLHVSSKRRPIPWKGSGHSLHVRMGLKLVETYDGSFQLEPQSEQTLKNLLSSQVFCNQVAQQTGVDGDSSFEFTGELFQPVPWSITTKHGMPQVSDHGDREDCDLPGQRNGSTTSFTDDSVGFQVSDHGDREDCDLPGQRNGSTTSFTDDSVGFQEFEKYLDRNKYAIINVPPNFMFKAKIFSPSRLCAVYKRLSN